MSFEEKMELLEEALHYSGWGVVFSIVGLVAIVMSLFNQSVLLLLVWILSTAISWWCSYKAKKLRNMAED